MMYDVFYTTRSGQVECDRIRMKPKDDETFDEFKQRAIKRISYKTNGRGVISHIGR